MTISNKYADIATTDNIVIKSTANADITLAGVSIVSTNDKAAINIENGANVKITLADNTVNTLTGAKSSAALQKIGWNGSLTITCRHSGESGHSCNESCGKLSATSYGDNAAIGSTGGNHAANITISGGNITAIGGSGAGIGCGSGSNSAGTPISSNINITGGILQQKARTEQGSAAVTAALQMISLSAAALLMQKQTEALRRSAAALDTIVKQAQISLSAAAL